MDVIGRVVGADLPATRQAGGHSCARTAGFLQRGSMAVAMMIMLLGLISMLGLIEVGYFYWAKRETQKVADLAALAGAQRLEACAQNNSDNTAARGNATHDNGFGGALTITCGYWDSTNATADHFVAATTTTNAVKVIAAISAVPFLHQIGTQSLTVQSEAVASGTSPIAAFSVGSQLLELQNNGLVPGLLKLVGLDAGGTTLVGYNGLANLRVTPAGLLKQLGIDVSAVTDVGTLNSLLAAQHISISNLLDAMIQLGEQQQLAQATIDALNTLRVQAQAQGGQLLQLGTDGATGSRGIFALIEAADAQSALNAQVNALDLVNVGLEVANSHHLVDLAAPTPGISAWVTIIEPPSIAIGGVGATAYTAQVRVGVNIDTDAIPVLGALLKALGTTVNIPLILDVTNGKGTLTSLCDTDAQSEAATIDTTASLLDICVGQFDKSVIGSTSQSCDENLQNAALVKVLGNTLVSGKMHVAALTGQGDLTLHQGETASMYIDFNIGDAVSDLITNVLTTILGSSTSPGAPSPDVATMANQLWTQAGMTAGGGQLADTAANRKLRMQAIDSMLTQPISPQTTGLLPGLTNLVGGLLDSVGSLLGGVLGAVTGDNCTTGLLGLPGGNVGGCMTILKQTLGHAQNTSAGNAVSNALVAPVGLIIDALRPVLNSLGDGLLKPLLASLLGEQPGRTDVHLMSLQCHRVELVY